jgi:ArsR family transcriptional regulator, arsenate/arsenite/antimonite-responsive transcriptional repressor
MKSYADYVPLFKAISDETRLKIIDMLSCGELCACDILEQVHITQSTLSYHMKILTESGIVKAVKDGSWMRYSINSNVSDDMISFLTHLTLEKEECICKNFKK